MSTLVSDGNYRSVGYDGLDRVVVGMGRSPTRTYEGDRLMHFFGSDSYTETGRYDSLDEDVRVLMYSDICDLKAFRQIKNVHGELKPGIVLTFRNGTQLLVTLDDEQEVQDLSRFLRTNMARCRKKANPMYC